MRWAGNVAHMAYSRDSCRVLVGRPWEGTHLEEAGLYGKIRLKQMFKKCNEEART